jgi:hypothetical protein
MRVARARSDAGKGTLEYYVGTLEYSNTALVQVVCKFAARPSAGQAPPGAADHATGLDRCNAKNAIGCNNTSWQTRCNAATLRCNGGHEVSVKCDAALRPAGVGGPHDDMLRAHIRPGTLRHPAAPIPA